MIWYNKITVKVASRLSVHCKNSQCQTCPMSGRESLRSALGDIPQWRNKRLFCTEDSFYPRCFFCFIAKKPVNLSLTERQKIHFSLTNYSVKMFCLFYAHFLPIKWRKVGRVLPMT